MGKGPAWALYEHMIPDSTAFESYQDVYIWRMSHLILCFDFSNVSAAMEKS